MISLKSMSKKYYTSRDVSEMFQLNESTIKRWADAGKLRCSKTPGGHRKFTAAQVEEFAKSSGLTPTNTHLDLFPHLMKNDITSLLHDHKQNLSSLFVSRAFQAETESLVRILHNRYSAKFPVEKVYDTIIGEAVRTIFAQHKENNITQAEKHVASTSIFESLLQFGTITQRKPANGRIAVCGSVTNGLREIILFGLSHLLELEGWKVYNLGANTEPEVLLKAVETYKPSLICSSWEYLSKNVLKESNMAIEHFTDLLDGCNVVAFDFFGLLDRMSAEWYAKHNISIISYFRELKPMLSEFEEDKVTSQKS